MIGESGFPARQAGLALSVHVVVTDVHTVDLGDAGFTSGVENGTVHTGPDGRPMEQPHRFTNNFQRDLGGRRIVHRHTDRAEQPDLTHR